MNLSQPKAMSFTRQKRVRYSDLSQIDFDALKAQFEKGRKRTEAEKLKKSYREQTTKHGAVEQDPH